MLCVASCSSSSTWLSVVVVCYAECHRPWLIVDNEDSVCAEACNVLKQMHLVRFLLSASHERITPLVRLCVGTAAAVGDRVFEEIGHR